MTMQTFQRRSLSRLITTTLMATGLGLSSVAAAQAKEVRVVCQNDVGDAALLNAAIAGSATGDEIVITGRALINQPIKLLGYRSYRGESRTGTVLRQADGANLVAVIASDSFLDNSAKTGTPVSISHLSVEGNPTKNTAPTCGIILRSWLSTIDDVQVRSAGGDGIRLTSLSENGTKLTNSQVNGRISNCFVTDSRHDGILVQDPGNSCTDWMLTDNWIAQSGEDGIHLENAAGWYVERNHVYGAPRHAIYAEHAYATSISNNYIEGFGQSKTPGTYYGIGVTLQGEIGSTIVGNRVFNFNGERTAESKYFYIGVAQVNYKTGYLSVTGNLIHGQGKPSGVGLNFVRGGHPGTALTVSSAGNSVVNVGTPRVTGEGVVLNTGF